MLCFSCDVVGVIFELSVLHPVSIGVGLYGRFERIVAGESCYVNFIVVGFSLTRAFSSWGSASLVRLRRCQSMCYNSRQCPRTSQ